MRSEQKLFGSNFEEYVLHEKYSSILFISSVLSECAGKYIYPETGE